MGGGSPHGQAAAALLAGPSTPAARRVSWRGALGHRTAASAVLLLAFLGILLHLATVSRSGCGALSWGPTHEAPAALAGEPGGVGDRSRAPPPRQHATRPLLFMPHPPVHIERTILEAKAAGDMRLARMAGSLHAHRLAAHAARSVQQAREAYRRALAPLLAGTSSNTTAVAAHATPAATLIAEAVAAVAEATATAAAAKGGEPVVVACATDATLPRGLPDGRGVVVAANLRNSEGVMPNFIVQLLALALTGPDGVANSTRGSSSTCGGVFVQIYESQSTDGTGKWLKMLRLLLEPIGVPCAITTGGTIVRAKGQERIEFLASVRNALLPPIGGAQGRAAGQQTPHLEAFAAHDILFVNDVFWCAEGARRLLHLDADAAYALDFWHADNNASPGHVAGRRRHQRRLLSSRQLAQVGQQAAAPAVSAAPEPQQQEQAPVSPYKFQGIVEAVAAGRFVRAPLYDVWVMRDRTGQRLRWSPPYGNAPETTRALAAGRPFPAYCGWGGLARVVAQPFADGLRFRTHLDGECTASECSLLCDDLHRMGYRRVLLDPAVRTTYDMPTAWAVLGRNLDLQSSGGIRAAPWSEVVAEGSTIDWDADPLTVPAYDAVDCCPKQPGEDWVAFEKCVPQPVLVPNHTAAFLAACAAPRHRAVVVAAAEAGSGAPAAPAQQPTQTPTYVVHRTRWTDGVVKETQRATCPP